MNYKLFILTITFSIFLSCNSDKKNTNNQNPIPEKHMILAKPVPVTELISKIPELAYYHKKLIESLKNDPPVLLLDKSEIRDEKQQKAQEIAIREPKFIRDVYHPDTKEPLRNEIMIVREALPGDIPKNVHCDKRNCYYVSMYNYFFNSSTVALVDIKKEIVIKVKHIVGGQAELNKRLTDLAINIAINSPEVIQALGINPNEKEATMSNVKTAMNGTKCERSKHLCVAPTFLNHVNKRALWAVVDLTDWKLVGIAWTELGNFEGDIPKNKTTETELQNDFVMENFCEKNNDTTFGDWKVNYRITSSDGLEVFDTKYKGKTVIRSSKIVDWHVSYLYKEGVGYSDATGCPMFSSSAVVAFNGPYIEKIMNKSGKRIGTALIQDFRSPIWPAPCNYRYQSRFEFYDDGSFRITGVNHGRGCNTQGVYKPVFRMDIVANEFEEEFSTWNGKKWQKWDKENWMDQKDAKYTKDGYWMKLAGPNKNSTGYYIEPGVGQWPHNRGDSAFVYISVWHDNKDEGDTDMITIGSCCSYNYRQGPEKFLEPQEKLQGNHLIIWYVPRMHNDNTPGKEYCWATQVVEDGKSKIKTWPGIVGPKFIPIKNK